MQRHEGGPSDWTKASFMASPRPLGYPLDVRHLVYGEVGRNQHDEDIVSSSNRGVAKAVPNHSASRTPSSHGLSGCGAAVAHMLWELLRAQLRRLRGPERGGRSDESLDYRAVREHESVGDWQSGAIHGHPSAARHSGTDRLLRAEGAQGSLPRTSNYISPGLCRAGTDVAIGATYPGWGT
jgi:hypothetical protein